MVMRLYEEEEDNPEEPAENNQVDLANGGALINDDGAIELPNGWTFSPQGQNGRLEIRDETNDTVAYIEKNSDGNLLSVANGGADSTLTYVTTDDESGSLENSVQHANMSGSDLHAPAEHGNSQHSQTYAVDGDPQPPEEHGNGSHSTNYAADSDLQNHTSDTSNPHSVTNDQVGVTSSTNTDGNYELTVDGDTYEFVSE